MSEKYVDPPPRTGPELAVAIAGYRRHRSAHPLPWGWAEADHGLAEAVELWDRGHDPDPMLSFRVPRPGGELRVIADYYYSGQVTTAWSERSGGGLTVPEVQALLYALVGLRVDPGAVTEVLRDAGGSDPSDPVEFDLRVPDEPSPRAELA